MCLSTAFYFLPEKLFFWELHYAFHISLLPRDLKPNIMLLEEDPKWQEKKATQKLEVSLCWIHL